MKHIWALLLAVSLPHWASSQDAGKVTGPLTLESLLIVESTADLEQYLWQNRLLLVFADTEHDPRFVEQMRLLSERVEDLAERDVLIATDASPNASTLLRETYRPRGFMLLLVGKDGQVYLRKPLPWNVREISRSIDKMPLRQQEIRARR